ncbi:MAG: hypothetical protein ICV63_00305 [Coleofasciculus sp. Co-bin14]|nr:hypothetical protein [Coleofasciculus sp. Co-bin14]
MSKASPILIAQVTDTHLLSNASAELLGVPTAKSLTQDILIGCFFLTATR